jgi:hypothetical protein
MDWRDMAQVVEHLPCKCESLCSNPRATKKKKQKTQLTLWIFPLTILTDHSGKFAEELKNNPKTSS